MKQINRRDISPIKMATNPPEEVVNAGYRVINPTNKYIYCYVGLGWVKEDKATPEDYRNIPELI